MTASFLRASLFTSVVAFGVSALVAGLGVLFILVGVALNAMNQKLSQQQGVIIYQSEDAAVGDPVGEPPSPPGDKASAGAALDEAKQLGYQARSAKYQVDALRRQIPQ